MRIVVHHNKFYDWEPVPSDVKVTPADLTAGKVKPMARGVGYLMKVTKGVDEGTTHTQVNLPEHQIIAKIVHDKCRPEGGRTLTRKEAVAMYLAEHVLPGHAHRKWLTGFEVSDDGPDEEMIRGALNSHVTAGNIEAGDVEDHVLAYMEKPAAGSHADMHVDHLHTFFKVKK